MTTARRCPVCGGRRTRLLHRQRFGGALHGALFDGYDVVVCRVCGCGFASGLPPQDVFDAYYADLSKYESVERERADAEVLRQRFTAAVDFLERRAPDKSMRVLDIGCASGGLLSLVRARGYKDVTGLDPSSSCAESARRLHDIAVLPGTLSDTARARGPYGVILLAAVLEHVGEAADALSRLSDLLAPGGLIYVEVPDVARFDSGANGPFQEFSVEHITYFSVTSLANLMARSGYEPDDARTLDVTAHGRVVGSAVTATFRVASSPQQGYTVDEVTEPALRRYIAASRREQEELDRLLADLADSGRAIIVWGVGTHTQRLLADSPLRRANIRAFVDSDPHYQGRDLNAVPILGPSEVREYSEPILISSRWYQREIEILIRERLGIRNELILLYRS